MCNCSGCKLGQACLSKKFVDCGDPECDMCYRQPSVKDLDADIIDFKKELERLRRFAEEGKALREKQYMEHIASLEKLPGAIRMFRTWRLYADGSLKAMTQNHIWQPGENVTLASGKDASADSGFYGFNSLAELQRQERQWWEWSQSGRPEIKVDMWGAPPSRPAPPLYWYVCGTILCYGHVKVSERGGRCQKAIPEYIIEPDGSDPDFGMLVVNAAEKYGMKIVSLADAGELNCGVLPYQKGQEIK